MTAKIVMPLLLWIVCGLAAAGGHNAQMRAEYPRLYQSPSFSVTRQSTALMIGIVGGPISLLVTAGTSGWFYHGWTLTRQPFPCTSPYPEIWCTP